APVPGHVKTRLTPVLTPSQAAQLHFVLVANLWKQLKSLHLHLDAELHTDAATDAWPEAAPHRLQTGGDLGERMLAALQRALAGGRPKVMILGADIHGLPDEQLLSLVNASADVVLGPSADGGYYAIACRRTHNAMFQSVRWSTPHALADTVAGALRCGLTIHVGQPWHDIDIPEDLDRLPAEILHSIREGIDSGNPRV
ncbi:MAG: TIGR04282 family arsenosugar biosynthesis glycosyltransferase, partial [Bryobacterales bacterium]|nr:TIGR04282 family arsenosugar biosynthesis glycosyltransferase [Bryobacterales bacterium]